jgi:leader peptidase (prepilin peptidase) / N-methyltransferase
MIEAILALLFGLLIGSFLNVCIYRWPRDLSVVKPRSHCPACEKTIAWYDNIPVVSYLVLGGRCRYCRARISWRYPVVELATGLLFFYWVYTHWRRRRLAIKMCVFSALLVGLVFSDLEERILPDEMTLGGM